MRRLRVPDSDPRLGSLAETGYQILYPRWPSAATSALLGSGLSLPDIASEGLAIAAMFLILSVTFWVIGRADAACDFYCGMCGFGLV